MPDMDDPNGLSNEVRRGQIVHAHWIPGSRTELKKRMAGKQHSEEMQAD